MERLKAADLFSLERYARERNAFRKRVLEHKKHRQLAVGPNTTWCFEDRLTIQYQVQEMLRAERIFEPEGIAEELDSYNPLVPDGTNWKVTLLIEFPDADERARQLARLKGIERRCWVQAAGSSDGVRSSRTAGTMSDGAATTSRAAASRVYAIADEDLERENAEKTSAVHFLRFELAPPIIACLKGGAALALGIDHADYRHAVDPVPEPVRAALVADLT